MKGAESSDWLKILAEVLGVFLTKDLEDLSMTIPTFFLAHLSKTSASESLCISSADLPSALPKNLHSLIDLVSPDGTYSPASFLIFLF